MSRYDFGTEIIKDENTKLSSYKFDPKDINRKYGVIIKSKKEEKEDLKVHYEIDVKSIKKDEKNNFFEINKHQVFINEKLPDSIIDRLSEKCGNVLYPLQVEVNTIGQVLRIINQNDIQERWEKLEHKINLEYKGDTIQRLLSNMKEIIMDSNKLTELVLNRDWFVILFFAPRYNHNKYTLNLPVIPYKQNVEYAINQTIKSVATKLNERIITLKGKCIDKRSERDILRGNLISLNNKQETTGQLELDYTIYNNSTLIDSIVGKFNLLFPSGKTKSVEIEMYNLFEKASEIEKEPSTDINSEKIKKAKSKKSFIQWI